MGVRINVSSSQDYSYLFQGLSSSGSGLGNLNFLSDYASIKNGSYGKLMKAYYAKPSSKGSSSTKASTYNILEKLEQEKKNPKVSKDVQEANSNLKSGLSTLKNNIATLQKDSTYTSTDNGQSAADKVVSAVKSFVTNYNDVVTSAKDSTLTSQTAYVANMMSATSANADKLADIGIKVNDNGTLTLNESKLKATDISKVQDLFSSEDVMSYGSRLASRVQFATTSSTSSTSTPTSSSTETDKKTTVTGAAGVKADGKTLASSELYEKVTNTDGTTGYDVAKIFTTAKSFVNNYNKMLDTTESSTNSGVIANLSYIRQKTAQNADALKQFGINVKSDGRMTIDEDTFKKSDMAEVHKLFEDYGSSVASNASLVDYYTTTQANASSGYTSAGVYNVNGSAGYTGIV